MTERPNSTLAERVRAPKPCEKDHEVRDDIVTLLGVSIQSTGPEPFPSPARHAGNDPMHGLAMRTPRLSRRRGAKPAG